MTDVRCWICRNDFMQIDNSLVMGDDGLPMVRCPTCGAVATVADTMRVSRQRKAFEQQRRLFRDPTKRK